MNYYKILNKTETHNNLKYKTGLNTDPIPFNPRGNCTSGGIYFSKEDIFVFLDYGPHIRKITLPEDAQVYENPGTSKKWKADKVILGRKRKWNNLKFIKELIAEGANPILLLMWASYSGYLETVKLLINEGVDPNIQNKYGNTPLLLASRYGHLEIVKLLKSIK